MLLCVNVELNMMLIGNSWQRKKKDDKLKLIAGKVLKDRRDVVVEVDMARGRKERFTGRITYVSSLVRIDRRYIVRAEVVNRQEHGRWLLRDGMSATMTIRLSTAGAGALDVSRTP